MYGDNYYGGVDYGDRLYTSILKIVRKWADKAITFSKNIIPVLFSDSDKKTEAITLRNNQTILSSKKDQATLSSIGDKKINVLSSKNNQVVLQAENKNATLKSKEKTPDILTSKNEETLLPTQGDSVELPTNNDIIIL